MRTVAIAATLLMLLVPAFPAAADHDARLSHNDECSNAISPETGSPCLRVDVPSQAPATVRDRTTNAVFVWLAVLDCDPRAEDCRTRMAPHDSKHHVAGTGAVIGVVYVDSNGVDGLQRKGYSQQTTWIHADNVLVA